MSILSRDPIPAEAFFSRGYKRGRFLFRAASAAKETNGRLTSVIRPGLLPVAVIWIPLQSCSHLGGRGLSALLSYHFDFYGDFDLIPDDHAAGVQSPVPGHPKVLPVDLRGCG